VARWRPRAVSLGVDVTMLDAGASGAGRDRFVQAAHTSQVGRAEPVCEAAMLPAAIPATEWDPA